MHLCRLCSMRDRRGMGSEMSLGDRSVTYNIERAFKIMIYSKLSLDLLPLCWSRFWEFWANHLISRLQLNHMPVHETHSAMVRKIINDI
jgi:hypothetical protein